MAHAGGLEFRRPGRVKATPVGGIEQALTQIAWFGGITAIAFAIPFVGTSVLDLPHDIYLLMYFAGVASVLTLYVVATDFDVRGFVTQNWQLSAVIGLAASAFVVWNVFARNDATPRPDTAYLAFEFIWRGAAYGVVDAILLTAFPGAVAFSLMHRNVRGLVRRVSFAGLALVMVIAITGVYHLGFEQFREDGIVGPETGNTIISVPMLVSLNPAGSIAAHTAMHIAAVGHAYETDVFLPPRVTVE
jgi:hypothetical protein